MDTLKIDKKVRALIWRRSVHNQLDFCVLFQSLISPWRGKTKRRKRKLRLSRLTSDQLDFKRKTKIMVVLMHRSVWTRIIRARKPTCLVLPVTRWPFLIPCHLKWWIEGMKPHLIIYGKFMKNWEKWAKRASLACYNFRAKISILWLFKLIEV